MKFLGLYLQMFAFILVLAIMLGLVLAYVGATALVFSSHQWWSFPAGVLMIIALIALMGAITFEE